MSVDQTPSTGTNGPAPVPPAPPPESIWATGGPPAAPPPGPPRRRRMLALVVALVVLAGAGIGVAAVLAGGSKPSASGGGSPTAPLQSPPPVIGLEAKAEALAVTLTWSPGTGGTAAEAFAIYRDGTRVNSVLSTQTTYTDLTVLPGHSYLYEVEATAAGGTAHSSRASVSVQTSVATLASARVEGNFNVKVSGQSHSGFTSFVDHFTLGWNFKPKCATGSCSVVWKDLSEKTISGTLRRAGSTYSGSDSGKFGVKCGSTVVTTTVTVRFHVAKAQGIDGEWRASKIVGTITESSASQLGCVASSATYNISATLVR